MIKDIFFPDGKKFYILFDQVADNLLKAARSYTMAKYDDADQMAGHMTLMRQIEHDNDEVTHHLFLELGRNFITPFNREDIHSLATSLDDIIDYMWSSIKLAKNYELQPDQRVQKFAQMNEQIVQRLCDSVKALKNKTGLSKMISTCAEMKMLINKADALLDVATAQLFNDSVDAVSIIKRMDQYEILQNLMEKCDDVVNVIESVIIKYG